jgi:hypothetical protein
MADYVSLSPKRSRGWPVQGFQSSLFGPDGWCRACGTPLGPQTGPLLLERRNITVRGAWMPYWWYDTVCFDAALGREAADRFGVDLRPVAWKGKPPGEAFQAVIPVAGGDWFDHGELAEVLAREHPEAGRRCRDCGTWRWMPLDFAPLPPLYDEHLPPVRLAGDLGGLPLVASQERFGDGWNSIHKWLARRDVAEFVVAAAPRDFEIMEVDFAAPR